MIATTFQRLWPSGIRLHDWASMNMHHVLHCGPFFVLAYKFTRLPQNRPWRRCVGGTLSMLQNVTYSGTRTGPVCCQTSKHGYSFEVLL